MYFMGWKIFLIPWAIKIEGGEKRMYVGSEKYPEVRNREI